MHKIVQEICGDDLLLLHGIDTEKKIKGKQKGKQKTEKSAW